MEITETNAKAEQPKLPPVGIIDLVLLTTGVGLGLALMQAIQQFDIFPFAFYFRFAPGWLRVVAWITFVAYVGLTLGCLHRVFLRKRVFGQVFGNPGNWLIGSEVLQIVGIGLVVGYFYYVASEQGLHAAKTDRADETARLILSLASLPVAVFLFVAAVKNRWTWTSVFAVMGLAKLMFAVRTAIAIFVYPNVSHTTYLKSIMAADNVMFVSMAATVFLLTVALIVDRIRGRRRDGLHWIAVGVVVLDLAVLPILRTI